MKENNCIKLEYTGKEQNGHIKASMVCSTLVYNSDFTVHDIAKEVLEAQDIDVFKVMVGGKPAYVFVDKNYLVSNPQMTQLYFSFKRENGGAVPVFGAAIIVRNPDNSHEENFSKGEILLAIEDKEIALGVMKMFGNKIVLA